jgi:hypothetical protein
VTGRESNLPIPGMESNPEESKGSNLQVNKKENKEFILLMASEYLGIL